MSNKYGFTLISHNAKTGPIPVTMTDKQSCPSSCPLKDKGCYAAMGRLNIHWLRLNNKGLNINQLAEKISGLPAGKLWRHNQAGDLPGSKDKINAKDLNLIVKANKGKRGFTYTHHTPFNKDNARAIKQANKAGFTVNLSADNLAEADQMAALKIAPVVTILDSEQKENITTPKGNKVVVCPNYTHNVQCVDCQLCQKADRSVIVGFPAHGIAFRRVNEVFASK